MDEHNTFFAIPKDLLSNAVIGFLFEKTENGYYVSYINSEYEVNGGEITAESFDKHQKEFVKIGFPYGNRWLFDVKKCKEACHKSIKDKELEEMTYEDIISSFTVLVS